MFKHPRNTTHVCMQHRRAQAVVLKHPHCVIFYSDAPRQPCLNTHTTPPTCDLLLRRTQAAMLKHPHNTTHVCMQHRHAQAVVLKHPHCVIFYSDAPRQPS